jgi:hypothetical protein
MVFVVNAVLLLAQFAPDCDVISVRNDFAAEFHGYYSFTTSDGKKAELIGVVKNGIGSIGTGSAYLHIIEFQCVGYAINVPVPFRPRDNGLLILVSTPKRQKKVIIIVQEEPGVLQGEYSRALPN